MNRSLRALITLVFVAGVLVDLPSASPSVASAEPGCSSAVTTSMQATRRADGILTDLDVTTVAAAPVPGGDRLTSVELRQATNSVVQVDGRTVTLPATLALPSVQSWTFRIHRQDAGKSFQVEYAVRDLCGEVTRFAGSGTGADTLEPAPGATATTTTPSSPTVTPTLAGSPAVTTTPAASAPVSVTPSTSPLPTDPPTEGPAATAATTFDPTSGITVSTARFTATYNSIGVEVPFTGDPNRNASASLSFRRSGESAWRQALPLWPAGDAPGAAFYGSALLLDAGTRYDVRVIVSDPDGVSGLSFQSTGVTTRADTIQAPESLAPTHYVRATGDDAADGRSPATAWRTIDKAVKDAPSGAVVQVGPGYYGTSRAAAWQTTGSRTLPLTLVAQYPAVDQDRHPVNAGLRTVIEPVGVSSPRGAMDGPNPGVWQQVTLTGPKTGGQYRVWQWLASPVSDSSQLGFAAHRADAPKRVAHWRKDNVDLATPAGWAEKLYTNLTYNYGYYSAGKDLYLRLPGDLDPNTLYITASGGNQVGLALNGPDIRVSGFEIRQFFGGVQVLWGAKNAVIDRSLLTGDKYGVFLQANLMTSGGVTQSVYGGDHTIQENLIQDASLWSTDPVANPAIPWMFVKSAIRNADGTDYVTSRIGNDVEGDGVGGRGGAQRVVVRRNTIDGTFNGIGTGYNDGFDRYAGQDMDVSDNLIRHTPDDALEPELATINFRAWNNRIEQTLTVLSTGPVTYGPVYLVRNTAWQTGNDGDVRDGQGRVPGTTMFKFSGKSTPAARIYVLHNTFWTDRAGVDGGGQFASSGTSPEAFYLRNNLIRATHYAFDTPRVAGTWNEDANYFVTSDTSRGFIYNGVIYRSNVQAYRDASRQGAHTNVAFGFTGDVPLANPAAGDLRLPAGSPLIDGGLPVPNVSDRPGIDYQGAAPDIGYEVK
jgi:hypothetical protein